MTSDEFDAIAWHDFVLWAWAEPSMCAAFMKDTGLTLRGAYLKAGKDLSPIERMIDAATKPSTVIASPPARPGQSVERHAAEFLEWVTIHHWGIDSAPKAYRDHLTAKAAAKTAAIKTAPATKEIHRGCGGEVVLRHGDGWRCKKCHDFVPVVDSITTPVQDPA